MAASGTSQGAPQRPAGNAHHLSDTDKELLVRIKALHFDMDEESVRELLAEIDWRVDLEEAKASVVSSVYARYKVAKCAVELGKPYLQVWSLLEQHDYDLQRVREAVAAAGPSTSRSAMNQRGARSKRPTRSKRPKNR